MCYNKATITNGKKSIQIKFVHVNIKFVSVGSSNRKLEKI